MRWDEVQVPSSVPGQPNANRRRLMDRIVVQHHMNFQVGWRGVFQLPQEAQELLSRNNSDQAIILEPCFHKFLYSNDADWQISTAMQLKSRTKPFG
jgi:hypothetical protein